MRIVTAYLIGLVFGLGISISGMANPAKVLNFFDIAGTWDPSLIFVMGGALIVTFIGYRLVLKRSGPIIEGGFQIPHSRTIDIRLIGGSALFGIGWGLSGFCPGGALPVLGTGNSSVVLFIAALLAGMLAARFMMRLAKDSRTASQAATIQIR
ncbi:MAG: YeeE/YedE family protein [Hyphomicrobiales bacterium]|nr:YeeE/YedE family protein [Hyphomicrobiales bacterium]